jgi:SAM-dependent methyltransferase
LLFAKKEVSLFVERTSLVATIEQLISLSNPDLAADLKQEFAGFCGVSLEAIQAVLDDKPLDLDPGSKTDQFYARSNDFLVNLIKAQMSLRHLTGRVAFVVQTLGGGKALDVLDIGGGIGNYCIALTRAGHRCAYADIPGVIMDFARRRFAARGCAIDICDVRALPPKRFHALLSFDVLEHLDDPVAAMAEYAMHAAEHGMLFLAADFLNFSEPFHLRKNVSYAFIFESILHECGFDLAYNSGMSPLESIIKAGIRVYTMERPVGDGDADALLRRANVVAQNAIAEYHSYFRQELTRLAETIIRRTSAGR